MANSPTEPVVDAKLELHIESARGGEIVNFLQRIHPDVGITIDEVDGHEEVRTAIFRFANLVWLTEYGVFAGNMDVLLGSLVEVEREPVHKPYYEPHTLYGKRHSAQSVLWLTVNSAQQRDQVVAAYDSFIHRELERSPLEVA